MALASMILAIIAFPTMFILIGILLAPVAFILGIIALVRANKRPAIYGGKGFAIAGIAVSSVVCFFFVPIIAAIAIPNILAAKRAANEGSAMAAMRKLAAAQVAYSDSDESGGCGNMRALAGNNLVHENLSTGTRNGYRFSVSGNASDTNGCEIKATPLSPSEGTRSFYYSSVDGVFRVQSKGGAANYSSPPVDSESD
jgi:type II secretory pathway pseudopilin PulG